MIGHPQVSSVAISGSPWILTGLTLLSMAVFLVAVWPKWRVLRQAPRENRFDRPVQRFWNTFQIAFLQTKMFKETAAGWMHAFIFWGFLVLLFRAAEFFFIGFFPAVEVRSLSDQHPNGTSRVGRALCRFTETVLGQPPEWKILLDG